ncbi:MAG: hypothetical protein H7A46_03055 [Verrucomicrobiales bacterium]|nr:hypothetical protein [Verrucomicrobiales bacterium]
MKGLLKILLYVVLLGLCAYCVKGFLTVLQAGMDRAERQYEEYDDSRPADDTADAAAATNLTVTAGSGETNSTPPAHPDPGAPSTGSVAPPESSPSQDGTEDHRPSGMGLYAAGGLLSLIGLALMLANDLSHLTARSTHRLLEGVEEGGEGSREYEEAERLWANADYLGAVHVLREYLKKHPRRVHAHFRIAEIYEKDLKNTLAAALEHEEILRFRLEDERWGWTAIHLCNLHYHLNQPEKAEALLHRIVNDYGHTVAAGKARKRLGIPEDGDPPPATAAEPEEPVPDDSAPSDGFQLPRGFRPK